MPSTSPSLSTLDPKLKNELLKGIRGPKPVQLVPPLRLFRFTDRSRGPDGGMVGPWWIAESDFMQVVAGRERSRQAHGGDVTRALSFGFMARWAIAVPQEWQEDGRPGHPTTVDLLVMGDLKAPVDAFVGRGKTQQEVTPNGIIMNWTGWPTITQIYIPALSRAQPKRPTFADVCTIMAPGAPKYIVSRPLYER